MPEVAPIKLSTTLGDALKFRALSAREELSRLFEFGVIALADAEVEVDFATLLGTPAVVEIEIPDGDPRHLHGIVAAAGLDGVVGRRPSYRLTLRPWLWLATRRSDTRIFQKKDVVEILREVFSVYGPTVRFDLEASYPKYEYCVQYRETDFNFASRLMEREGIYYYFTHTASQHEMVICDRMSHHSSFPGHTEIKFRDAVDAQLDFAAISQWRSHFEIPPGKVSLDDYDFVNPTLELAVSKASMRSNAVADLEFYDWPGEYLTASEGNRYARLRMEELDARYRRVSGSSFSVRGIAAGRVFSLIEHPHDPQNDTYVVVSTQIEAAHAGYEAGSGESRFDCRFEAIPHADVFRPERVTPKPIVPGPQTAVVVGPAGEEIHTDVHGRVKVQFHWDRLGRKDENSSCWLRTASPWAGKAWGMITLPRIGQEVVVDFIEGDPDQPLITGRVYNADQITPYLLPDNKTVSTIKSRSSAGGEPVNFNEIAFEDKVGSEFIRLHAEKDFVQIVKHDAHLRVDNDQYRVVVNHVNEDIGGNTQLKIAGNAKQHIVGTFDHTGGGDAAVQLDGKLGAKVAGDVAVDSASFSLKTSAGVDVKIGANLGAEAGANVHIKGGANVVIEAGAELTLKGAMINVIASGMVNVKGSLVNINTGGGGGPGSGASPKTPAAPEEPEYPQPLDDIVEEIESKLGQSR